MGKLILFLQILSAISPRGGQGPSSRIDCHYLDTPFPVFCDSIYRQAGVRIYYHEPWIENLLVRLDTTQVTVLDAVRLSVEGHGLGVSEWNGHIVLIPGVALPLELPAFRPSGRDTGLLPDTGKALTESEARYLTGRKADVIQAISIGQRGNGRGGGKAKILGRLTDAQSGEPLIGATIYIEETGNGTTTDDHGFLTLILTPGSYTARIEYLGYLKRKYLLEVMSDGEFKVEMARTVIQMQEVVVYGDRQQNIRLKDPGLEKISVKSIKEIPMMLGERDILKVSEMLPGIVTVGEGAAGLNVRGGNADQNAFYLDKIPIYNTSHAFGFLPAFQADFIKDFSIYKGHIPAKFGGRLSSVFNIITRQGNRRQFTARGGISPITANLMVEGPLKKDTCSFILGGRLLYSDWILGRIKDPLIRDSKAGFGDFSAGLNYDLKETQMALFLYHSKDRFNLSDLSSYAYSNSGASLSFNHNFGLALRMELSFVASQFSFSTTDRQLVSTAYEHRYALQHYEFRSEFDHSVSDRHSLEYGAGAIIYRLDRGWVRPYGEESNRIPIDLGKEQALEGFVYLSDTWEALPWLSIDAGLRYGFFSPFGEASVITYADGSPKELLYADDTLHFHSGQPITWYSAPEIRAAVNIRTDPAGSVKLAFDQAVQNLFMLSNTIALAPNTQWKLADFHLPPSHSRQFSIGIFRTLGKAGWEASVEAYLKTTSHYPEYKDGADFIGTPHVETVILQGKQNAYGVEALLKRSNRKLEGWIAYTWSRSLIRITGEHDWEKINDGETYPANFDIPHALNAVINYHFNRRVTLSSVITYQTGRPVTYPTSVYYINGVQYVDYSSRNAYRIPDYFRIDASLTLEGNLRKNKPLHSSLVFNVYNLTGRQNPYSVYFVTEQGKIHSYRYSVIGVPVFTVTWLFKLGNYASD